MMIRFSLYIFYRYSMKHKNVVVMAEEEPDYPFTAAENTTRSPPVLQVYSDPAGVIWTKVTNMNQLILAIKQYKDRKEKIHLTVGNTAYGIQIFQEAIKKQTIYIHIADIPELLGIRRSESMLVVGAAEILQALYEYLGNEVKKASNGCNDPCSTPPMEIMHRHMMRLATTEVRNAGSVGGNLYLAKMWGFPSDLMCLLMTLDALVVIRMAGKITPITRKIDDFMKDDNLLLDGTNIIESVHIPITSQPNTFVRSYKISHRPQNSHPIVNAGFVAQVNVTANTFTGVRVVFGNIAKLTQRMPKTEEFMMENCTPQNLFTQLKMLLSQLYSELASVVIPSRGFENVSAHGIEIDEQHRVTTARNLFLKYLIELALVFKLPGWKNMDKVITALFLTF